MGGELPSAGTMKSSRSARCSIGCPVNAIQWPSGDHLGFLLRMDTCFGDTERWSSVPSALATTMAFTASLLSSMGKPAR